ncbi:hypothetical protein EBT16_05450, partial [bacterium]|nr:hypothetical protein [bacterium]
MLRAGDDVPPVVIRQTGPDSYHLVDGNHRQAAAQAVGKKQIRAFLLKDPYPSKGMGIKNIKKSEARTSRIKPMNPQLPFLMHLNFHPHDNEVWVENNSLVKSQTLEGFEKLVKGKKDGLKMYGATPTPEQKAHVDWSYSKLPNENWATWSIRGHRENPSAFTPEVKQKLEHYALHPSSDIQNIRFDKSHDLNSGLQMLKDADSLHKLKGRLAEKPETANKIMDAGNGFEWWDLGKSQCSSEGKAMEHCGNDFDPQEGDNLLSLRKKHVIGGKTYYEPHLTFVENNGVLTEMRGRGNTKPEEEYHPAIAQLLKGGHLPVGVEYSPEGNFSVDDFSEGVYDSVKRANPKISLYRDDDKEVPDSSLLNLYAKRHPVESIHDRFRQAFLSRLTELDNLRYPQLARNLRNNKSAAMELAYDVDLPQDIQPVLASLDNKEINRALAFRDDLNPELQVNFAKNPDLAHTISEKHDLAQDVHPILASYNDESINKNLASLKDLHPDVLDKFIENPNLHKILADNAHLPKHLHARLASLGDSQIKRKLLAAQGNKISSEAVSLLANELMENPDDAIAEKLARLENLPPELHSKVASAGNNENIVQELLSKRKDLNPDTFKLLAQNPKLASWLVKNPNLPPELHTNIAAHGDHEANVELARFTKPELLKHLIDTNGVGSWVHEAAAQNKNITPELLKHLVEKNQAGSIVHLNAVMNQNIHPELLKHLIDVNKPGSRIHEYAAINPQITPDAFKHLIENNKSGSLVHLAAALNKNIIPETLKYLVERNEAGSEVHHRAAENPNLTLEAARYIASKNRPDSNIHRLAQEAIRRLSSGNVNKSESLDKNLAGLLTGAALNLMSSNPSATAQKPVAQARPSWSPEGLHQDMLPIAHLESNFGKNTQHAAHSKGEYHTAVGAVGLKPVTAHEEYKKSK